MHLRNSFNKTLYGVVISACYNVHTMKKLITLLACACLLTAGCTEKTPSSSEVKEEKAAYSNFSPDVGFDTVFTYKESSAYYSEAEARYDSCCQTLLDYNALFDIYNDYEGLNNIKTINDNAGIAPVEVDPVIIDMLKMAKTFYDLSDGEFDITIGSLLKIWHRYRENGIALNEQGKLGQLPLNSELEEAAQHRGWEHVIIDEQKSTVYIDDKNISLDVGGIAKGYAAEAAAKASEENGMDSGFVNVGRNIRTVGEKPGNVPWRVGIADPDGEMVNGVVILDQLGSFSFVTSGDYERFYVASDGVSYSHIIDPETMYPAVLYRSVTILTPDSAAADCLSTTLFTLSVEDGMKVLENYTELTGNSAEAVWLMEPGKAQGEGEEHSGYWVVCTNGLEDTITWGS